MSSVDREDAFTLTPEERPYVTEGRRKLSPYATDYSDAVYECVTNAPSADTRALRPSFVRDVDRVLNNAFYNRCMDKTQVFPFYRNDDLTRRSFHLQLVAQVARKIGSALRLNTDLIEAIALGHDMGHTPFGHGGERILSDLYHRHTSRYFNHNVHSVRILRDVATCRLSLQTFNGILCHCGEKGFREYQPQECASFKDLDAIIARCSVDPTVSKSLRPSTLEGCVVRICDMLGYLGKDRQDALNVGVISNEDYQIRDNILGPNNSSIIDRVSTNIIKRSIDKPFLSMDPDVFDALMAIKDLNSKTIYASEQAHERLDERLPSMMEAVYDRCLADLKRGDESTPIFCHHIHSWVMKFNQDYVTINEPDDIVMDYIASMTDDYFVQLYNFLFPQHAVRESDLYHSYFESMK